jgi:CDP-diacylglycerol---glycerol-3-phosphate 3-phosphatidyltransferase
MKKNIYRHIPNILTIIRIVGAGVIFYWIYRGDFFEIWKIFVLVLLLSTDWLDGWVARRYNWISAFWKILDPIADKVILNGLLITMIFFPEISLSPLLVGLVLFREIGITVWRIVLANKDIIVPADSSGKIKTWLQTFFCIAVCIWIYGIRADIWHRSTWFTYVFIGLFLSIVIITLLSWVSMIWKFYFQKKHW